VRQTRRHGRSWSLAGLRGQEHRCRQCRQAHHLLRWRHHADATPGGLRRTRGPGQWQATGAAGESGWFAAIQRRHGIGQW